MNLPMIVFAQKDGILFLTPQLLPEFSLFLFLDRVLHKGVATLLGTHFRIQDHKQVKFSGWNVSSLVIKRLNVTVMFYNIISSCLYILYQIITQPNVTYLHILYHIFLCFIIPFTAAVCAYLRIQIHLKSLAFNETIVYSFFMAVFFLFFFFFAEISRLKPWKDHL